LKKLLLIILLLSTILYSQKKGGHSGGFQNFGQLKPTVLILPVSGSTISLSYLYRIPYNRLIFEKSGNSFKASVRILVEVIKDDEFIKRDIVDKSITVSDFEITESKSVAIEGVINFNLEADDFNIKGLITDLNSQKEFRLATETINALRYLESGIFKPIVINLNDSNCSGSNLPLIVNFGGSIPYSSQDYQLVIPVADTLAESVTIEMRNNENEPITKKLTEYYLTPISVVECDDKLFIGNGNNISKTKNFILRNFSNKLNEGILITTIKIDDNDIEEDFPLRVVWLHKPFSLRNPEFAIEMLKYIEDGEVVSKLLGADEEDYQKELYDYWQQYDPTPDTKFNELMEEFYSRIDYAAMEFRGISKKNGLSTDRGKIYIKHGKPDKIERSSDSHGYVVETWIYNKLNQKFLFVDKQGTGNFILING
jgi:GWxTD domain-containing protein